MRVRDGFNDAREYLGGVAVDVSGQPLRFVQRLWAIELYGRPLFPRVFQIFERL